MLQSRSLQWAQPVRLKSAARDFSEVPSRALDLTHLSFHPGRKPSDVVLGAKRAALPRWHKENERPPKAGRGPFAGASKLTLE
jgi:hypothetical protein